MSTETPETGRDRLAEAFRETHGPPVIDETAMRHKDVPDELVRLAMDGLMARGIRACLAAVLPAHGAMVRAKVAKEVAAYRSQLLSRPAGQRPDATQALSNVVDLNRRERP